MRDAVIVLVLRRMERDGCEGYGFAQEPVDTLLFLGGGVDQYIAHMGDRLGRSRA